MFKLNQDGSSYWLGRQLEIGRELTIFHSYLLSKMQIHEWKYDTIKNKPIENKNYSDWHGMKIWSVVSRWALCRRDQAPRLFAIEIVLKWKFFAYKFDSVLWVYSGHCVICGLSYASAYYLWKCMQIELKVDELLQCNAKKYERISMEVPIIVLIWLLLLKRMFHKLPDLFLCLFRYLSND